MISSHFSVTSFAGEIKAAVKAIHEAKQDYPASAVVQAVVREIEADEEKNSDFGDGSEGNATDKIIHSVSAAYRTVRSKSGDQEANFYADFLKGLAKRVAESTGEGFFGTGEKVSGKERTFLKRLETEAFTG